MDFSPFLATFYKYPLVAALVTVCSVAIARDEHASPVIWASISWRILVLLGSIVADIRRWRKLGIYQVTLPIQAKIQEAKSIKNQLIWGGDVEIISFFSAYVYTNVAYFKFAETSSPLFYYLLQAEVILGNIIWVGGALLAMIFWAISKYKSMRNGLSGGNKVRQTRLGEVKVFTCMGIEEYARDSVTTMNAEIDQAISNRTTGWTDSSRCLCGCCNPFRLVRQGIGYIATMLRSMLLQRMYAKYPLFRPGSAECKICHSGYADNDTVCQLDCEHCYHEVCFQELVNGTGTCLVCAAESSCASTPLSVDSSTQLLLNNNSSNDFNHDITPTESHHVDIPADVPLPSNK
ncbi:hypothetical protein BDV3_007105 [Batrachochytrium dendrobatidis]|nr:hypothetical protein BDEG_25840 [Batrachochytrium dendrobatidis JEL423]